jgi:hypothetical protein
MWMGHGNTRITIHTEEFTLKMAGDGVRRRLEMCNSLSYPMLSDCRRIKDYDKETRQLLKSPKTHPRLLPVPC